MNATPRKAFSAAILAFLYGRRSRRTEAVEVRQAWATASARGGIAIAARDRTLKETT